MIDAEGVLVYQSTDENLGAKARIFRMKPRLFFRLFSWTIIF